MIIKNGEINTVINFLDRMKLSGRQSLGRTKLKEKLLERNEVFGKDQQEIIDEYKAWTDKEKLQYQLTDEEGKQSMADLINQETELVYDSPFKKDFTKALEDYDVDLEGSDADVYALLYEELTKENE